MLNVFRWSREPIVPGSDDEAPLSAMCRLPREAPRSWRITPAGGSVAVFLTGSAAWSITIGSPWPLPAAIALTLAGAGLKRGARSLFGAPVNSAGEMPAPNPDPVESNPADGGLGMAKQQRRGRLAQIPQERLDRYSGYFDAGWQRVQVKAASLVRTHDGHRRSGSCSLHHDVHEVMSEGFLRVLHDPKEVADARDFVLDMFRQMEGYLSEQRRRAVSKAGRHEPIDDEDPQEPGTVVDLPLNRPDDEYEQRHALERARRLLEAKMPRLVPLFDLTRLNLSIAEIAERLDRTPEQISRDRYTLLQFLKLTFNSGEQP